MEKLTNNYFIYFFLFYNIWLLKYFARKLLEEKVKPLLVASHMYDYQEGDSQRYYQRETSQNIDIRKC